MTCPICNESSFDPYLKSPAYKICRQCGLYQQDPLPEKIYEGPQENFGKGPGTGHLMSEEDKLKNKALADALFSMFQPETVLDIGSKYPAFLNALKGRAQVLGIDGVKEILQYGQELGIPVLNDDVETMYLNDLRNKFDLITLVHVLEHFYYPPNTLRKILSCLTKRGILFIRTPDPEVSGIERDLTDHHLKIHPYLFTRKSIDRIVKMFGYKVFRQDKIDGYGQSDFYIHKNMDKDNSISLCMIVRNEEKNIEDCLNSIKYYVDEIVIVDTGSTDKTKEIALKYTDKIYDFKWVDDFSAARNFSISKATKAFLLYADADDVFQNPQDIRYVMEEGFGAYNFTILYGNDSFSSARLFRNFSGVYFKGRVHEYPVLHNLLFKKSTALNIIHKTKKFTTENRILRNTRILSKELEENPDNARTLFYMANTLREAGRYDEAIETYRKYLPKSYWRDERFMAQKYIGQIYQHQKQHMKAIEELFKAVIIDERWAEAYYYIGENYFLLGKFDVCIRWMLMASSIPMPESSLFKEIGVYQDLPYRYLFACYDTLGDYVKAREYCVKAVEKSPDDDWLKQRLAYFDGKINPPSSPDKRLIIECYRQGALGDCLMTTAAVRGLKWLYPGCFIRYITHPLSMQVLEGNRFIDELTSEGKPDVDKKVFFCYPDKDSVLKDEGYPDKPLTRHLTEIFWECADLPKTDMGIGSLLECTLNEEEERFGGDLKRKYGAFVTVHTKAGWSPYKEWYADRWEKVIEGLLQMGYTVFQIMKSPDEDPLKLAIPLVEPIKRIISAIKYSSLHIGIDSFSNHASQAVGKKSIILFGSTSPTGSGYEGNINIWKGLECSPCYREYDWSKNSKGPCPYNKKCMDSISVDEVMTSVKEILTGDEP